MLVGAAKRDLSVNLFGHKLATPLLMAPIGVIGLCARDGHGDLATAKAAAATGVPMIASTLTVDPLEDVAKEFGNTPGFFQLYTPNDRELAESFVHRAEAAGFAGIVVTLDTPVLGWRRATCDSATSPSCTAIVWPTTRPIRYSERSSTSRRRRICERLPASGRRYSRTRR